MHTLNYVYCVIETMEASQGSGQCGRPVSYPDKRLDERYAQLSEFKNGDRVAYKCSVGHRQTAGNRVSFCRNGQWEPLTMKCTRKQCGSAGEIQNGRYVQKGNLFGDKAYAECDDGYVLQGEPVRECLDNGWNGTIPSCIRGKTSFMLKKHLHSLYRQHDTVSVVFFHSRRLLRTRHGLETPELRSLDLYPKSCPLPDINNGETNGTKKEYKPGESLSLSCNVGHRPRRNITIAKCHSKNGWEPKLKCDQIKCEKLVIPNGGTNCGRLRFNTTVKIYCDKGFQLKGAEFITCAVNASWAPACSLFPPVTKCPRPTVANSRMQEGRDYRVGERVTIVCQESFNLIGSPQITCGPNGQWQALPECLSCPAGKCGRLPHHPDAMPRQGYLSEGEYEPDVYVRFSCNPGYRWAGGSLAIRCKKGRWTPLEIRCERKSCGSAGEIANGRFQYTGVSFGDTATAECFEGYHLVGFGVRHCRAEGWDGRTPVCEVVKCPSPPEVPGAEIFDTTDGHAEYGHVVSYRCRSGSLIGPEDLYCTERGTWSPPPPRCQDISCPKPNVQSGGRILGVKARYRHRDVVTLTCNLGWRIQGSAEVSCGPNGEWTPALPTCVPIQYKIQTFFT
uniref:Sushi domain-containing protein n=1 Tax=Pygocentrus nattereri TaxID=42514 RepID=A0AAR2KAD9_PYGNA